MTRREFVKGSLLLAATATLPGAGLAAEAAGKIRLGGPVFDRIEDPEELALAHRRLGYRAAYCPGLSLKDADKIKATSEAFRKHDVAIAEVGRWVNMMDADPEKRRGNIDLVTQGLALAEAVGALCCVDIAGSFNEQVWYGPHPKNFTAEFFDSAVENARKIIDAVKPKRAKFCYEMMGWAIPDTVESYLALLKAVDRPAFGVHLDPCNAINSPLLFYQNTGLLNECFDKLGRHIVSCHAKDLAWKVEMNVHFEEVRPGLGALDYATYLKRLAALPHNPPLMLEHLPNAEEYSLARRHIFDIGKLGGLAFE